MCATAAAQTPPPRTAPASSAPARTTATTAPAQEEGELIQGAIPGELQLRYTAMSALPLDVTPGSTVMPDRLGQHQWVETWIRFRPWVNFGRRLRVVFQIDLARAVIPDAPTQFVGLAHEPRSDTFPYGPVDLRWGYIQWDSPVGVFRLGQQGFTWGLGVLANDGDRRPLFGDYRAGDIVERVAFATRPGGRHSNVVAAIAGDLVYRDRTTRLVDGDIALQGLASVYYQHHACTQDCERKRVGALAVWRDVSFADGSYLRAFVGDLSARWHWPTPDRTGRVFAGAEVAVIAGTTDAARTVYVPRHDVLQVGAAAELGIERPGRFRVALEGGYTSGDRNPLDTQQRRFHFNPAHRVGLILFPEVMHWQTARSAEIARDPDLAARPPYGTALLPTQGGVAGAAYLYPNARVNLGRYVDLRGAAVVGVATSDVVDPTSVQRYGSARNYRGGESVRRDLGLELDLGVETDVPLSREVRLQGGVQAGVFFPGRAMDDRFGAPMGRVVMGMARFGLVF